MSCQEEAEQVHQKTEVKDEVVESVGENQPAWLDTLKEEIANLK
jgi:hypothetical protein